MKTFFKALLFIAPVVAIVLWYVWMRQDIHEHKIEKESVKFDQQFNRSMKEVSTDKENKKQYSADEAAAGKKLTEMEKDETQVKKKQQLEATKKDFDEALKEYDKNK
jgi:hypothetical protein